MTRKRLLCAAVWIVALAVCLFAADRFMRRDDGERKYGPFFENKDEDAYDVLFFGTSRVLDGVQPVQLWRDFGITSYNMGNNSEPLGMTEWTMRIAFERHKPKVALIDVYYIDRPVTDAWTFPFRHVFLDEVPLSPVKLQCVMDTLPRDQWLEFLMPFSLYHGRWEEMATGSVERMVECEPFMMGSELRFGGYWPLAVIETLEADTTERPGWQDVRDIVALCRENGVMPVLMCLPSVVEQEETLRMVNGVSALAQELDVPYLNMMHEGIVDVNTDFFDGYFHMNNNGAAKVTAYLGEWLMQNAPVTDRRGEPGSEAWDEAVTQYEAYIAAHTAQ